LSGGLRAGNSPQQSEVSMDFGRVFEILYKRKWLMAFAIVLTMVGTWLSTRLTGSRWVASIRFVVPTMSPLTEAPNSQAQPQPGQIMDPSAQAQMYTTIARSPEVLEAAVKKVKMTPPSDLVDRLEFEAFGPRLFELHITDTNPKRAGEFANAIADAFEKKNHSLATQQARKVVAVLEEQLKDAEKGLVAARTKYETYARQNDTLGNPAAQLSLALRALEIARSSRGDAQARISQAEVRIIAKRGQMKGMPETVSTTLPSDNSQMVKVLQDYLARNEIELMTAKRKWTDTHPIIKQLEDTRKELNDRLTQELKRKIEVTAPNPTRAAIPVSIAELEQEIAADRALIEEEDRKIIEANQEIEKLRSTDTPLGALAQEVASATETRANMATRVNSARMNLDVAEQQTPLVIIERVNDSNPPKNANKGRTMKLVLLAAICAFLVSAAIFIVMEQNDRRPKSVYEVESLLATRVLAVIPPPQGVIQPSILARATEIYPLSPHAEAFRFLGQHLLNLTQWNLHTIMAFAAKDEQGTTETVANLAITLAQSGHRVIVVDANTRTPSLHTIFETDNVFGLTDVLRDPHADTLERALFATSVPGLSLLPSGQPADNPWELFSTPAMRTIHRLMRDRADYVLFDTPSAQAYTDALSLCSVVEAALLCVRVAEAPTGAEGRLIRLFEQQNVRVLGCVIKDAPQSILDSYSASPPAGVPVNLPEPLTPITEYVPEATQPAVTLPVHASKPTASVPEPMPASAVQASYVAHSEMPTTAATSSVVFYPEESVMPTDDTEARIVEMEAAFASRLQAQDEKIARLNDDRDRLLEELAESRRRLAVIADKETALASTIVMTEQRRVQVEQELEQAKAIADAEVERIRMEARQEADSILAVARHAADETQKGSVAMWEQAEQARQDALAEAEIIRHKARAEAETILADMKQQMQAYAELHQTQAAAEADQIRSKAHEDAEAIVADARRHAEETRQTTLMLYRAHEEQLKTLGAECNEIVLRIRQALEARQAQLSPTVPPISAKGRTAGTDLQTAQWLPGSDWRNAS
jgi:polysaccharide biosynthesis transport protein